MLYAVTVNYTLNTSRHGKKKAPKAGAKKSG